MRRPLRRGWLVLLCPITTLAAGFDCKDAATCEARVHALVDRLGTMKDEMKVKQVTLSALEELRQGLLSGKRIDLPSAQRQHLERGSPLIGEVSFDARHRPVSTNASRHFRPIRTVAPNQEVRLHTFVTLRRQASTQKAGPSALVATIDAASAFSLFDAEGATLLEGFDLGHGAGREVSQLVVSPTQDGHFVVTVDDAGHVRVHSLKMGKDRKARGGDDHEDAPKRKQVSVSTNFSCAFSLPQGAAEPRRLTAVLAVDRGSHTFFVTGDSTGGIAVFFRNGTLKGRVRVTEDPGGIQGLQRAHGQMTLFYSSHSFGFFSATQIDVQTPACSGWNSPLFDVALDPSTASSRVVLALSDGDVLVFSTKHGKSSACDLVLKFPHVSALPFRLLNFRGHVIGLPTALPSTPRKADYLRELYFFSLAAMEAGYGVAASRSVALQASFKPRQPESMSLQPAQGGPQERGKSLIAIKFEGEKGLELFDLSLKMPAVPKAATGGGGGGGGGGDDSDWASWFSWFPKIGVFGIALVGVVIWNVRKVAGQKAPRGLGGGQDDFEDDLFKERLRERRERRGPPGGGGAPAVGDDAGIPRARVEEIAGEDED